MFWTKMETEEQRISWLEFFENEIYFILENSRIRNDLSREKK